MGFLFEVAQVEAQGWLPTATDDWCGIYLEVYLEKVAKKGWRKLKSSCCGRRKTKKQLRKTTETLDEAREMRWRVCNEDGFLMALFVLGDERKRQRKGDQLVITADAFQTFDMGQVEGTKVATFKGTMQVGTWGPVVLHPSDKDKVSMEGTTLVLETRPTSARPFSLDNARPADDVRSLEMIMQSIVSKKKTRNKKEGPQRPAIRGNFTLSAQNLISLVRRGNPNQESASPVSMPQQNSPRRSVSFTNAEMFENQASSQSTNQKDTVSSVYSDGSIIALSRIFSSQNSQGSGVSSQFDGSTSGDQRLLRSSSWPDAEEGNWRKRLLGVRNPQSAVNLGNEKQDCFQQWIPTDWANCWKSVRGSTAAEVSDGTDVVPLMEAEFRRDCVVFFNTLYPRVQGGTFAKLRRLALEGDSSLQFRKVQTSRFSSVDSEGSQPTGLWHRMSFVRAVRKPARTSTPDKGRILDKGRSFHSEASSSGANAAVPKASVFIHDDPHSEDFLIRSSSSAAYRKDGNPHGPFSDTSTSETNAPEFGFDPVADEDVDEEGRREVDRHGVRKLGARIGASSQFHEELLQCNFDLGKEDWPETDRLVVNTGLKRRASVASPLRTSESDAHETTIMSLDEEASGGRRERERERQQQEKRRLSVASAFSDEGLEMPSEEKENGLRWQDANGDSFIRCQSHDSQDQILPMKNIASMASLASVAPPIAIQRGITPLLVKNPFGPGLFSSSLHGDVPAMSSQAEVIIDDYSPRIMLLKRLLLCFATCGVYYSEASNSAQLGDIWPYPLAAVLGHGSRTLIRLEDVESSEFLNFLLSGDPQVVDWKEAGIPAPLRRRIAATHSVELAKTGQLIEKKLRVTNAADTVQNISDGIRKKHLGLDLPIGGVGNQSPLGPNFMVGFRGEVISKTGVDTSASARLSRIVRATTSLLSFTNSGGESRTSSQESRPASNNSDPELVAVRTSESPSRGSRNRQPDGEDWRIVRRMQGGHLYIRTDDFGVVSSSSSSNISSEASSISSKLREEPSKESLHLELAKMRQKVERRNDLAAGDLFFPESVVRLKTSRRAHLGSNAGSKNGGLRLLRVSSEPDLSAGMVAGATAEDVVWVGRALVATRWWLKPPPSSTALRMLLENDDPLNAQLYGTGSYKSVEAFYQEIVSQSSVLARSSRGGLQRFCRPVVLQLRYRGHVLMRIAEINDGAAAPVEKITFAAISANMGERWRDAVERVVRTELCIKSGITDALTSSAQVDSECLTILNETTSSPSYPGMISVYRTHMVCWEVREDQGHVLAQNGLHFPRGDEQDQDALSKGMPFNCHFMTQRSKRGAIKRMYWRWVPFFEAQKLQRFINMGEATADERWAKYAFQKEGVVQFPPTETALAILLRRCGIDVTKFGTGKFRTLHAFWLDLTDKDSLLQMSGGRPLRLSDATVVRVRHQPDQDNMQVLVKEAKVATSEGDEKTKVSRKLLTRRMLQGESWEESALLCIAEELNITSNQARQVLTHRADKQSCYTFLEEKTESDKYPGISCLYRTHLVMYFVKPELASSLSSMAIQPKVEVSVSKIEKSASVTSLGMRRGPSPSGASPTGASSDKYPSPATSKYIWTPDTAENMAAVKGANLWSLAKRYEERHHICSVLLGLEGTAPQMKSPFGIEHDGSGLSANISAVGNCKWRSYRANNALQVPAEEGGLRMRITRQMFNTLRETCKELDLQDPSFDLSVEPGTSLPRELLNQRLAEKELFKRILSSNALDAKKAVEWMLEYRAVHKTYVMQTPRPKEDGKSSHLSSGSPTSPAAGAASGSVSAIRTTASSSSGGSASGGRSSSRPPRPAPWRTAFPHFASQSSGDLKEPKSQGDVKEKPSYTSDGLMQVSM